MAQEFLNQLPKVQDGELPEGAECMICQEQYGTVLSDNGVLEHALLLPCLHHVGSECIATWLKPDDGPGNSCPMCRTIFFPERPRDYEDEEEDEDEDEDDDEDDESNNSDEDDEDDDEAWDDDEDGEEVDEAPVTILAAFQRVRSSIVNTPTREETEGQDGREWFQHWPSPTSQYFEDSLKYARQALLRPLPSGLIHGIPLHSYSPPVDFEFSVEDLASAYRTLAFRETLLYLYLKEAGARIPPLEFPHRGLSAQHAEALLWELGQRGAFSVTYVKPGHLAMTNRQSWYVHRAKGEVFTYEIPPARGQAFWSTDLELDVE